MAKNEVQVTITAKDNASGNLKKITGAIDGVSKSVLGINLTDIINPATMAAAALGTVAAVVKKGVADFAAYGEQVGDVSRKLGITAEESSKLIQVADDLEVDYSVLTQAMKEGLKDGIIPSIDGLADLATEYQSLTNPADRAAFATEKFGRAGLEMQKILETAPEKLKEMGEAVELSGLLMDEQGVKAAKEYRLAVDSLGDSWSGLVARVMPGVVKGLTGVNNAITDVITTEGLWAEVRKRGLGSEATKAVQFAKSYAEVNKILTALIKNNDQANKDQLDTVIALTVGTKDLTDAEIIKNFVLAQSYDATTELTDATNELAIVTDQQIAASNTRFDELLSTMKEVYDINYLSVDFGLAANIEKEISAINIMLAGGGDFDEAAGQIKLRLEQGKITAEEAKEYYKELAIGWQQTLIKAGETTGPEAKRALMEGFGMTWAEAQKALAEPLRTAAETLNGMTVDIVARARIIAIDFSAPIIDIPNTLIDPKTGQPYAEARAGGGPVQPGGRYVVGENGPESLIMGAAGGQVYPTTNNYNLTIHSQAQSEQVQASFAMMRALAR